MPPWSSTVGRSTSSCGVASGGWRSSTWATSSSRSPRPARPTPTPSATSGSWSRTSEEARRRLEEAGAEILRGRGLDFRDPWGNHVQVVEYSRVQFTKAPGVLGGMGLDGLEKSPEAMEELRKKGLG